MKKKVQKDEFMDKLKERTLRKRKKILDSAISLFLHNDLKKITLDDIAKQANVSKVTIYKYFGDKEIFYKHIAETILYQFYHQMESHHLTKTSLTQRMISCTLVLIDFITSGKLSICLKLSKFNAEVKNEYDMFQTKVKKIIMSQIQEGKRLSLVRSDISDEVIYHYIDMGLNYFQCNLEYREKMMTDLTFSKEFMGFIWSNIFIDFTDFQVTN